LPLNRHRRNSLLLVLADALSIALIFNIVAYLRGAVTQPILWQLGAPLVVFVATLHLIDGYGSQTDMLSLDYASLHLIASLAAALLTLLLTFVFIPPGFELQSSRSAILASFAIVGPLTLTYRRVFYSRSVVSRSGRKIVFAGDIADFEVFRDECTRLGINASVIHADSSNGYRTFEALLESIATSQVQAEAIVVKESGKDLPQDIPLKLVQLYFDGIPTYTLELFHRVYWRKIPLYRINPIWLFQEGFQVAREPVFERLKRLSDVAFSVIGLALSLPIVGIAALAIYLDDGGPVFFVQTRVGKHKIPFSLIKLRTMRAAEGPGDPYTRQGDMRVTRVGRVLRSARLDELPQLWNVLRGQMSLIGPRAEWDRLVSQYEKEIPSYHFRHMVKPGITGWAQVNYRYGTGITDTIRKLEYDLYYIRNYSFMLDASIVLKTLHVMVLQKGH
jgi:exopolysaccharide biosynthesis polyprenyl glycosylphosphotransferase